jgi:hypothetical protein
VAWSLPGARHHLRDPVCEVSYLSFAHVFDRSLHWRASLLAATLTFCAEPSQLHEVLLDAHPTFLGGPPRTWQELKAALEATLDEIEQAAVDAEIARVRALLAGGPPPELSGRAAKGMPPSDSRPGKWGRRPPGRIPVYDAFRRPEPHGDPGVPDVLPAEEP